MKIELKFSYDDDDQFDKEAHLRILKSLDLVLAISDIQEKCMKEVKHSENHDQWEEINTFLYETLESRGICIDEMLS